MARRQTRPQQVAAHLLRHGKITPGEAIIEYGRFRLADAILKLRGPKKHLILGKRIVTHQKFDSQGNPYGEYRLAS